MTTPTYSTAQREYWTQRPANVLKFDTIDFYHPDNGHIRLVADQFSNKTLNGDSYQAVAMDLPQVTNQTTDSTKAGTVQFGRIGTQVRQWLLAMTPLGAIKYPITATLRQFEEGVTLPIYERTLFVDQNGISISSDSVNVKLSIDNPSKLTNKTAFYDPFLWKGLQNL
tara:strand:+ start:123 stop:626 length:504 start_codon:yes stop_codon:yes gene_type:complete